MTKNVYRDFATVINKHVDLGGLAALAVIQERHSDVNATSVLMNEVEGFITRNGFHAKAAAHWMREKGKKSNTGLVSSMVNVAHGSGNAKVAHLSKRMKSVQDEATRWVDNLGEQLLLHVKHERWSAVVTAILDEDDTEVPNRLAACLTSWTERSGDKWALWRNVVRRLVQERF